MEIVKKNILSVVCGVIAIIALVALVWPVSGMYADQQAVLDKTKTSDTANTNLLKAQRFWPVIPDMQSGEKTQLKAFPTEEVIKSGIAIKDYVHGQAETMRRDVVLTNERDHPLLLDGILPVPKERNFTFQQQYLTMVQDGLNPPYAPSQLRLMVEGTFPLTEQNIRDEGDRLWNAEFKGKIINVAGKAVNQNTVVDDWQKACAGLEARMRVAAAAKAKLYLEPNWLNIQRQMLLAGNGPKDVDIWYAQNMLWVQTDVCDAIKRINANAHGVQQAPIKHVFQLEVPDEQAMYVVNPNAGAGGTPDAPGKSFGVSMTGRVCNPLYDVIQFNLVVNVEAAKIPVILAELQRTKLITVLQADHSAVDGIAAADNGYIYGDVPVARLTIRGEELFLRGWTAKLMPPPIQAMLGVQPPAPGQQQK